LRDAARFLSRGIRLQLADAAPTDHVAAWHRAEASLLAGEFDAARLVECEELGMTLAAGLEAGMF
jgi:hypothetical protein